MEICENYKREADHECSIVIVLIHEFKSASVENQA